MKLNLTDLWTWEGAVDRGPYAFWGLLLFAIKYNIDRFAASIFYNRLWSPFNYYIPAKSGSLLSLTPSDYPFYAFMLLLAIPFIWTGTVLTLKRLRSLQFSGWLVLCFFIPLVNLLFFLILCLLPAPSRIRVKSEGGRLRAVMDRVIPDSQLGSVSLALLVNVVSGVCFTLISVQALKNYGWGLFVGMPFCLGLTSVLFYGYHRRRSWGQCMLVSLLSVALVSFALLAVAVEGAVCLIMAAPLAAILALIGGSIGYAIQFHPDRKDNAPAVFSALLLFLPMMMSVEHAKAPAPSLFEVRTSMDIKAPPEKVWHNVVVFAQLPEPNEWLFKIGIAYPIRARIDGTGVGAVRHCVFSTGEFVEPIQVWDEPRLLKFSVTANPAPMQEWTPYPQIHPAHLSGFLLSRAGQFRLIALPGGGTRLEGTTWYQHRLWPEPYWKLWSDFIIHTIHLRVLNHIKRLSE